MGQQRLKERNGWHRVSLGLASEHEAEAPSVRNSLSSHLHID